MAIVTRATEDLVVVDGRSLLQFVASFSCLSIAEHDPATNISLVLACPHSSVRSLIPNVTGPWRRSFVGMSNHLRCVLSVDVRECAPRHAKGIWET